VLGLAQERVQPPRPIVMTSALNDQGIDELAAAIAEYHAALVADGSLQRRRRQRVARELQRILVAKVQEKANAALDLERQLDSWVESVMERRCGPYALVRERLSEFLKEHRPL